MAISARALVADRGAFRLSVDALNIDPHGSALLGRNGAGKSTLLLALQGLVSYAGRIERPRRCAGVFAQPAVLHGSVLWNVSVISRAALGLTERAARDRAEMMLARVDLSHVINLDARRLSSGQRQRLALARAIAVEPQALFLDEPFANVDADGRPALRKIVLDYVERSACVIVLATQNLIDVTTLCENAFVLDNGRLVETLNRQALAGSDNSYIQALLRESRPG